MEKVARVAKHTKQRLNVRPKSVRVGRLRIVFFAVCLCVCVCVLGLNVGG